VGRLRAAGPAGSSFAEAEFGRKESAGRPARSTDAASRTRLDPTVMKVQFPRTQRIPRIPQRGNWQRGIEGKHGSKGDTGKTKGANQADANIKRNNG